MSNATTGIYSSIGHVLSLSYGSHSAVLLLKAYRD